MTIFPMNKALPSGYYRPNMVFRLAQTGAATPLASAGAKALIENIKSYLISKVNKNSSFDSDKKKGIIATDRIGRLQNSEIRRA